MTLTLIQNQRKNGKGQNFLPAEIGSLNRYRGVILKAYGDQIGPRSSLAGENAHQGETLGRRLQNGPVHSI